MKRRELSIFITFSDTYTCTYVVTIFRYVRALGALYLRIVGTSVECYKYLEPLYNDYRKIKYKNRQGSKNESFKNSALFIYLFVCLFICLFVCLFI